MERRGRGMSGAAGGSGASRVGALALAASLGLSACVPRHRAGLEERMAPVSVEVDNQAFHDAEIYTLIGGARTRLGTVTGEAERRFTFPWTPLAVAMEVHVIGGSTYDTSTFSVQPGDRLSLVVMPGIQPGINLTGGG